MVSGDVMGVIGFVPHGVLFLGNLWLIVILDSRFEIFLILLLMKHGDVDFIFLFVIGFMIFF